MNLKEIADQITVHLKRFESVKKINKLDRKYKTRPYYNAHARQAGSKIAILYISYQGWDHLSKDEAENYLAWLDAGNIGKHRECAKDREFRYAKNKKPKCEGCGEALKTFTMTHVRIGTRDDYVVCAGRRYSSGYAPKKTCLIKARAKLALCPGCDGEHTNPGAICYECREIIDRGQNSGEVPVGYVLDAALLGPYLEDSNVVLELLCRIAAPEGLRRWDRGSLPNWADESLGGERRDRTTGMPAVELDSGQKEALLALCAEIERLMKSQRLSGVNEGSSVLHQIMSGELSVDEINDLQIRKEKLYGESE